MVNSRKFNLVPDRKRYIDYPRTRNNHPKVLGVADVDALLASGPLGT